MKNNDTFAVLVVSCDAYADLWRPFFQSLSRYWPDCPFPLYLLSNRRSEKFPGVRNILVGDDISWSDNLQKAIGVLKEDYLLLFIEDLFLVDYVRSDGVRDVCRWMADTGANYVRLNPTEPPDRRCNDLVGLVSRGTIYRTSTVLSVWKKEVLCDLLQSGESAWEFEVRGSLRADRYDFFYSTHADLFSVVNGVVKGRWDRGAVRTLSQLGIPVDLSRRRYMNTTERAVFAFKKLRWKILHLLPAGCRRYVKHPFLRRELDSLAS